MLESKNFNAKDYMDFKAAKRMEVCTASKGSYGRCSEMEKEDPFRIRVIVRSGIGSLPAMEAEIRLIARTIQYLLVPK